MNSLFLPLQMINKSTFHFVSRTAMFAAFAALVFVVAPHPGHAQESTTNTNEVLFDPYFGYLGAGDSIFSTSSVESSSGSLSFGGTSGGLPFGDDGGTFTVNAVQNVAYVQQTGNLAATFTDSAGVFNQGSTEIGMYANGGGAKQVVAWRDFKTAGDNTGSARSLQVGDVFTITVSATAAFGGIGFSLNDNGTQGSSYANRVSGSRLYVQEVGTTASWEVNRSGGFTSLNYNVGTTRRDYTFEVYITSESTANVRMLVNGVDGGNRAYNLTLNGTAGANIDAFSMWLADDWNGASNADIYWKQETSVENTGVVELGYYLANGTVFTPGLITDGLEANSTGTSSSNEVRVGGDAGSQVNFNQNNTYTGTTTVNGNATLEAQHANALGSTAAGTTVSLNGALKLFDAAGITFASEALTLNGTGVNGAGGSLRNEGGDNTWQGTITLGSNSRINANTGGASGSLTIAGSISGGNSALFVGALGSTVTGRTGGNITISGQISGNGSTQDGITTSVFKDGIGALTLSGANTHAGATLLNEGTILIGNDAAFGTGTLQVHFGNFSATKVLASTDGTARSIGNAVNIFGSNLTLGATDRAGSLSFSGNVNLGNDTSGNNARTITTASGTSHTFSGAISGNTANPLTKDGAGSLTLSGSSANTYVAATTVSGGTLNLNKTAGVNAIAGNITVNTGATLLISQSNQVANTSAVTLSGGTITRGSGVSEVFGNLNLTQASFLNFGTGTVGTMSFGTYTPSSLLTVNNFFEGNTLTFGSDLTSSINGGLFSFDNAFTSSWDSGTSTFTITAIPEPSTYVAAAGLLAMFLWPVRRRLIKDAKSILGLRPTGRDRIEAYRNA